MTSSHRRLGSRTSIAMGFLAAFAVTACFAGLGLHYLSDISERLKAIVENNNVKIELATSMQAALRERALSMHALSVMDDPFDMDEEVMRFDALGADYIRARQALQQMPLSPEEREILDRIRSLTRAAQPEVQAVVDMAMRRQSDEAFERIRSVAVPRQRQIAEQVSALVEIQKGQTAAGARSAEESYREVRNLILSLVVVTLCSGVLIALFVSRQSGLAAQALYDPLTGLPNRSLLQDRLEQGIALSRRNRRPFGVALMDLNRFKEVNDTLGHDVGDELLREVATRLRRSVRAQDTVARMGGDEFVILLHDLVEADVAACCGKLVAALSAPFEWDGHAIDLGASIGIALCPSHARSPGALIRFADIAMYAAKRSGRAYALYAPEQERVNVGDLSLKSELREAVRDDQLVLHYQPKVCHESGRVVGLEALVRWQHPRRGLLMPGAFIPQAEEAGMIDFLSQWVLQNAVAQLAALHARGYPLSMAVNLSASCLRAERLPEAIESILVDHGMAGRHLTVEITESVIMSSDAEVLATLGKLDLMGIRLAIDDFGTGYSSLAHLKRLPVDEIKVDKSFVMELARSGNDAVIVRSTIDLAHNLGLEVTAEGVESRDAWDVLGALGCDNSQGFHMGQPLPAEQLFLWLEESEYGVGWRQELAPLGVTST